MRIALTAALILAMLMSACGSEPGPAPSEAAPDAQAAPEAASADMSPAALHPAAPAQASARPAAFAQCVSCHAVEPGKNGIGPSLAGVVGAKAGSEPSFAYSTAMRQSGIVWDAANLDRYLKDPRAVVPGTKMAYGGLKDDARRAELIAWLGTI